MKSIPLARLFRKGLFVGGVLVSLVPAHAGLRLPALFSDHLMLQANQSDAVWGWADPGAKVAVALRDGQGASLARGDATAGSDGRWALALPPLAAGAAGTLQVTTDRNEAQTIQDVLVGRVWLAGGQSNMEYLVKSPNTPPSLLALAQQEADDAHGALRYFHVEKKGADAPLDDVEGAWTAASAATVGKCSATAWYFGVRLREQLGQPVGLIVSCVGGTPAEAWMPKPVLDAAAVGPAVERRQADRVAAYPEAKPKYDAALAAWQQANPTPAAQAQNAATKPHEPRDATSNFAPCRFYNAMIHGLAPYTVDGVIWYQGDGNSQFYQEYPELITTLIRAWRRDWNAELPFYYVEMNNMWDLQKLPVEDGRNLALTREAQEGALTLPKTDVAAAIDLADEGAITNPHFWNKQPLGRRLADEALAQVYGQKLGEVHSPEFDRYAVEGSAVRLHFRHADGLRVRDGGAVKGFAIRGASGGWVWAEGRVDGSDIVVSQSGISQPKAVRYAWAANPVISIENGAGLPLRPFRTDKD